MDVELWFKEGVALRKKRHDSLSVGQAVVIRRHGERGVEDIAWGVVVGGVRGRTQVRIERCVPDIFTQCTPYDIGQVVEVRRADGLVALPFKSSH